MDEIIERIYHILRDYRDDGPERVQISIERITQWINQFPTQNRLIILTEIEKIFTDRYFSKERAKKEITEYLGKLAEKYGFKRIRDLLKVSKFIDVQPEWKSQRAILNLTEELFIEKCNMRLSDCGQEGSLVNIYFDDIFSTGSTFVRDIRSWINRSFNQNINNLEALKNNLTYVELFYFFVHKRNFLNSIRKIFNDENRGIFSRFKFNWCYLIDDDVSNPMATFDSLIPLEYQQSDFVKRYQGLVEDEVRNYRHRVGFPQTTESRFYRPNGTPRTEILFSNAENRRIVETTFLVKGIEALNRAARTVFEIRALGYSQMEQLDFGFGSMSFTWRNIPNNAPLVFWYAGGGISPLFVLQNRGW